MTFEELKNVIVETLNADADAVTMEASLADDLNADSLDAVGTEHGAGGKSSALPFPKRNWAI